MLPQASYIIKARPWPVFMLFLITGGPFLIALFIDPSDKVVRLFLVFATALFVLFYVIISKHYLYIDNDVFIYKSVLLKRQIRWQDIIRSEISWTAEGAHSASINWSFITRNENLELRLGLFSRAGMQVLAQQLIDQAPQAHLSKKIYEFADGKFPWYLI